MDTRKKWPNLLLTPLWLEQLWKSSGNSHQAGTFIPYSLRPPAPFFQGPFKAGLGILASRSSTLPGYLTGNPVTLVGTGYDGTKSTWGLMETRLPFFAPSMITGAIKSRFGDFFFFSFLT